jgi:hypothetical protein
VTGGPGWEGLRPSVRMRRLLLWMVIGSLVVAFIAVDLVYLLSD